MHYTQYTRSDRKKNTKIYKYYKYIIFILFIIIVFFLLFGGINIFIYINITRHNNTINNNPKHINNTIYYIPKHINNSINNNPKHINNTISYIPKHINNTISYIPKHINNSISYIPKHINNSINNNPKHINNTINNNPKHINNTINNNPKHINNTINNNPKHINNTINNNLNNLTYFWNNGSKYQSIIKFYKKNKKFCKFKYITWKYTPNTFINIDNILLEKLSELAINAWQEITYNYIYFIKINESNVESDIEFRVLDNNIDNIYKMHNGIAATTLNNKYIYINFNIYKNLNLSQKVIMLIHEIGHSIGLYDNMHSESIMYFSLNKKYINMLYLTEEIDDISIVDIQRIYNCNLEYYILKSINIIPKMWKYNNITNIWYKTENNKIKNSNIFKYKDTWKIKYTMVLILYGIIEPDYGIYIKNKYIKYYYY
ncbi:hypothetical protein MYSEV_050 [Mythimna separata entomopoxvirus 'L']|uniref:Uncharacterized protein n=1 Tax=Mythimna separata entomopoxvirus 'L' TaxID=1293572 RepID=A0A916KQ00_9POXV|nr:hypothetical protein MYSEV_050 [Mythimna separata entomopoxvirus 'L']CCU56248.1 hypothetical protein MYSEV_050 [Mythimna separata entomopoxvirus 'L']